jgi:hypothetical protein
VQHHSDAMLEYKLAERLSSKLGEHRAHCRPSAPV